MLYKFHGRDAGLASSRFLPIAMGIVTFELVGSTGGVYPYTSCCLKITEMETILTRPQRKDTSSISASSVAMRSTVFFNLYVKVFLYCRPGTIFFLIFFNIRANTQKDSRTRKFLVASLCCYVFTIGFASTVLFA
jgi:hypothetical protein